MATGRRVLLASIERRRTAVCLVDACGTIGPRRSTGQARVLPTTDTPIRPAGYLGHQYLYSYDLSDQQVTWAINIYIVMAYPTSRLSGPPKTPTHPMCTDMCIDIVAFAPSPTVSRAR